MDYYYTQKLKKMKEKKMSKYEEIQSFNKDRTKLKDILKLVFYNF